MMRVFVAGATGVIGRSLVPMLVSEGYEVTGMTRSSQRAEMLRGQGATAAVCDALDADAVREAVSRAQPEALIHELTELPTRLDPRRSRTQLARGDEQAPARGDRQSARRCPSRGRLCVGSPEHRLRVCARRTLGAR